MEDRMGFGSRMVYYREGTEGSDTGITEGRVVPLVQASGYGDTQEDTEVPVFMGDGLLPYDSIPGPVQAGGALRVGIDYEFMPEAWADFIGPDGYNRPGGGTNTLHELFIPPDVGARGSKSFQLQKEWLEGDEEYLRGRGNKASGVGYEGAQSGFAQWNLDVLGTGDMVRSDLAGTKHASTYEPTSYFDGLARYTVDGTTSELQDLNALRCRLFNGASRREAFFMANGMARRIRTRKINGEVEIGFPLLSGGTGPESDLNFYDHAVARKEIDLMVVQSNAPIASGQATKFMMLRFAALKFARQSPAVGGADGIDYLQRAMLRPSANAKMAAMYLLPTGGPYAITAGVNDKLGIKLDGGIAVTVTLPVGTAVTAQAIVDAINGAIAGAAELFLGKWILIWSATKGALSSVQIDTGVAQTGHALFGADNVARSGRANCPFLGTWFNVTAEDLLAA